MLISIVFIVIVFSICVFSYNQLEKQDKYIRSLSEENYDLLLTIKDLKEENRLLKNINNSVTNN